MKMKLHYIYGRKKFSYHIYGVYFCMPLRAYIAYSTNCRRRYVRAEPPSASPCSLRSFARCPLRGHLAVYLFHKANEGHCVFQCLILIIIILSLLIDMYRDSTFLPNRIPIPINFKLIFTQFFVIFVLRANYIHKNYLLKNKSK